MTSLIQPALRCLADADLIHVTSAFGPKQPWTENPRSPMSPPKLLKLIDEHKARYGG